MSNLRTAAQQALERLRKYHYGNGFAEDAECIADLEAALAQQAEPDHETRAELAEQQVVQLAEERDHYRNLWQKAQQDEPAQELVAKMTAGRAVYFMERFKREEKLLGPNEQAALDFVISMLEQQAEPARERVSMDEYKRLQGLVTSQGIRLMEYESKQPQQAEPVEPVAWDVTKDGRLIYDYDFTHDAVLRVMGDFEDDEQRVRYAQRIVDKLNAAPAQQAEPVEPVAWRSENANPPGGYVIFQQYPQALADLGKPIQPLYTAPPQRKLVPLTAQELDGVIERHVGGSEITDDMYTSMEQFARAVEKASWEKNNG